MKTLISDHPVFFTIVAFDLIVGLIVLHYYRSVPRENRSRLVAVFASLIGALVNVSGLFCSASVVEILAVLGGLPLCVWLLPEAQAAKTKKA